MLPKDFQPKIGMMLGSGMGVVADAIENPTVIPYGEVPGFPVSTVTRRHLCIRFDSMFRLQVSGHSGQLVCGKLEGVDVVRNACNGSVMVQALLSSPPEPAVPPCTISVCTCMSSHQQRQKQHRSMRS